ncbi:MAG: hypothetical protein HQK54_08585, partial [Oligoflexales bacterium]|nr:hypothetical protein [Oligoflexales bacterium]
EVDWCPVINQSTEKIEKMLVTLRDVTSLRELQAKNQDQKDELGYISEIIGVPEEKFARFVQSSEQFISENRRLINSTDKRNEDILKIMFINMHTMKGTARSYAFVKMTGTIHDVEQYYAELQKKEDAPWDKEKLLGDLQGVENLIKKYAQVAETKLGRSLKRDKVFVNRLFIENKIKELQSVDSHVLSDEVRQILRKTQVELAKIVYHSSEDLFTEIFGIVDMLARDLGKEKPAIEFKLDNINISETGSELVRNVFVHILRNSMDHGIEPPEERAATGKPPAGKLMLSMEHTNDTIVLRYKDDGRGINLGKLREMAESRGLLKKEEMRDHDKVANIIFKEGISTSKSVSDISGRGVGMGAIKEFLENKDGGIKINLEETPVEDALFSPFNLEIFVPLKVLQA